ncbi:hypothetical protein M2280_005911 [Prescottella agglutinans]|jgi:hypothetical protein|uniref:Uncharacterized protein n=1 Tax=Prescottella agglutinans TaxID=1644129 RepID=A0ABT6MKA4_9NOCA|nr:hypothetical protein [Prescottella agglutinans]
MTDPDRSDPEKETDPVAATIALLTAIAQTPPTLLHI